MALVTSALVLLAAGSSGAGGGGFVSVGGSKAHGGFVSTGGANFHTGGFKSGHGFRRGPIPQPVPSVFPTTVDPWKFWGAQKHFHHPFSKHGFVAPGVVFGGGTAVVYVPTATYAAAPDPVAYAAAPVAYAPTPMPTVVDYPTGRYELRGDGITTAYQWVWIPKPPPAPPAPPEAAPEPGSKSTPSARDRAIGAIYRWTDDEGVTTFTDRLENVPEKYRSRVRPKA